MDGSNSVTVVTGLSSPQGITIDFETSRLFWTDHAAHRIESSNLQGGDRHTVVHFSSEGPWGIAVGNGRLYWGELSSGKLRSSTVTGEDMILHSGTNGITYLTFNAQFQSLQKSDKPLRKTQLWKCLCTDSHFIPLLNLSNQRAFPLFCFSLTIIFCFLLIWSSEQVCSCICNFAQFGCSQCNNGILITCSILFGSSIKIPAKFHFVNNGYFE